MTSTPPSRELTRCAGRSGDGVEPDWEIRCCIIQVSPKPANTLSDVKCPLTTRRVIYSSYSAPGQRYRAHPHKRCGDFVKKRTSDTVEGVSHDKEIPDATVSRLPVYRRSLVELAAEGQKTVSSARLAELAGVNAAKVRKDLPTSARTG